MAKNCMLTACALLLWGSALARAQDAAQIRAAGFFSVDEMLQQPAPQSPPPQPGQTTPVTQPQTGGLLPGTFSAPPLTVGQKFSYRVVQSLGFRGFAGAAVSAALGQWDDSPHEWGQGAEGYAKRFASSLGSNLSRQTFAFVLDSAFKEDPRYFPMDRQQYGFKDRTWNALKQAVICKKDDGSASFAWSKVISAFAAGQMVNAWQPKSNGTVARGFERGFITLGGDAGYNLIQEFFPFIRPHSVGRKRYPSAPTNSSSR